MRSRQGRGPAVAALTRPASSIYCAADRRGRWAVAGGPTAGRFDVEDFELALVHYVAAGGFVLAAVFGFVANKTNFCTMGAVSDMLHLGSLGRLGAWCFATGLAILGARRCTPPASSISRMRSTSPRTSAGSATSSGASPSASA